MIYTIAVWKASFTPSPDVEEDIEADDPLEAVFLAMHTAALPFASFAWACRNGSIVGTYEDIELPAGEVC